MTHDRLIELIHGEIDGVNSPEESTVLSEHLSKNPETQKLFEDLYSLSNILDKTPKIDPPKSLEKLILNSIPVNKLSTKKRMEFFKLRLRLPNFAFQLRYAYVFVAGLAIGIVSFSILYSTLSRNRSVDISTLYGTMMRDTTPANFQLADQLEIHTSDVEGAFTLKYTNDAVLADILLESTEEIALVLEFDRNDLDFSMFKKVNTEASNLAIDKDQVKLSSVGKNQYYVVFNDKTPALTQIVLKVYKAGSLIYEKAMSTGKAG
ncbi:MAG: hypothetical protein HY707_09730 [Ignavibacteriae bacterium]|nr:hypothetical protein [Ignavibacteriota bacterium]